LDRKVTVSSAEATNVSIDLAGMGSRALAFLIDWSIRVLVAGVWLIGTKFAVGFAFSSENLSGSSSLMLVGILPAAVVYFLYHPVIELITRGRTPGKRMVGIRVADMAGGSPGAGATLIRNVFRLVDSAPMFYLFGLTFGVIHRRGLRLGDLAAGTQMVFEDRVSQKSIGKFSADALKVDVADENKLLILDLVNRWRELTQRRRIQLGGAVLQKNGVALGHLEPMSRGQREREVAKLLGALLDQDSGAAHLDASTLDKVA